MHSSPPSIDTSELEAAAAAGVDDLVGIDHACHRELCAHEATSPFQVVNFLELVGEAMGVEKPDLFKQWKMMQDVDRILAEVTVPAAEAGLDLETVREVLLANMLAEQPLPMISAASRARSQSRAGARHRRVDSRSSTLPAIDPIRPEASREVGRDHKEPTTDPRLRPGLPRYDTATPDKTFMNC